jgi:hypothetical protein
MSTFLSDVAVFAVKPAAKRGFYEIASVPQICNEVRKWLDYEKMMFGAKRVKNAKFVGLHDALRIFETDVRFYGSDPRSEEDSFVVVKRKDGTFAASLQINAPEAAILRPILHMLTGETGWAVPWVELTQFKKKKAKSVAAPAVVAKLASAKKAATAKNAAVKPAPAVKKPEAKKAVKAK